MIAKHWLAIAAVAAVLGVGAAQAQGQTARKLAIRGGGVTATFTTATVSFNTSVATSVTVSTGTDKNNLVDTNDGLKLNHSVTVRGLAANTRYFVRVTATPKSGKAATTWQTFNTAKPGTAPAKMELSGSKFLLNGQPWFPLVAHAYTCPNTGVVEGDTAMGLTALGGPRGCVTDPTQDNLNAVVLHDALQNRAWYFADPWSGGNDVSRLQGLDELLPWPDRNAIKLDYFTDFSKCLTKNDLKAVSKLYAQLVNSTRLRKPRVFVQYIVTETVPGRKICADGVSHYANLWTQVAGGVRAMAFITQRLWDSDSPVDVPAYLRIATRLFTSRLATLGPVVLTGSEAKAVIKASLPVKVGVWGYSGNTYAVAVNTQPQAAKVSFTVPGGGKASAATVMWENRSLKAPGSTISDRFAPWAVHIYKMK